MIGSLLFAGYDTTCNQLGHGLFNFACFPAQWSLLAAHPELAGQAVDEVMRLHGAIVGVPRIAAAEVEVDGWVIPPGTVDIPVTRGRRTATTPCSTNRSASTSRRTVLRT